MTVSYKKLWKQLIDRNLKKKDLEAMAQASKAVETTEASPDFCKVEVKARERS